MKNKIKDYFKGDCFNLYQKYLQKVSKIGDDEYKAICPFHPDTNPSLNFNAKTGQFYCFGCKEKGDIFDFYAKQKGLNTKTDFPKIVTGIAGDFGISIENKKNKNKPADKFITKTWPFVDEEGQLLYQEVRYDSPDGKDYRPRHKKGNKWSYNLNGVRRVLYQLPAIIKADEVMIAEGPKCADTIEALGFISTTILGGCNQPWLPEFTEVLKGKNVCLFADNDEPGKDFMIRIAKALDGKAKSLKMIELPDLPEKGDIADWAAQFEDVDEAGERLAVMIENADLYQPPRKVCIDDAILDALIFNKIELSQKRIIIDPWLPEQSISLITGWRGTGKTWLAMSLLDAITKGEPFGPWEMGIPVPCLYLEAEMPAQDVRTRLNDLNPSQKRKEPLYVYSDAYANTLGLPKANLLDEEWRATIKRILADKGVKVWVVDNLASLTGGIDENAKKDWDPINTWLLELRFAGIASVLLHHTGKGGNQRGTSAREDNIDTSIMLKRPFDYTPEDGAKFIINFQKSRVATKDLALIGDTQFHLTEGEKGQLTWTSGNVRRETKVEVLKMFDEGMNNQTVVDTLGLSKGYVSKIKKSAIEDGLLSQKGKLTQSGFDQIYAG